MILVTFKNEKSLLIPLLSDLVVVENEELDTIEEFLDENVIGVYTDLTEEGDDIVRVLYEVHKISSRLKRKQMTLKDVIEEIKNNLT